MKDVPIDPRQAALVKEIVALESAFSDFEDALRNVNRDDLTLAFREILDDAKRTLKFHLSAPSPAIADHASSLRRRFARTNIPREDPDLGKVPGLTALRSARGSLLADFDMVLDGARALGLIPQDPELRLPTGAELDRAGREGQLAGLERRLREVERELSAKIAPEGRPGEGRSQQQIGLVNFYVESMIIEIALARLETKAREIVDLKSLARAIESIGELTADFVATVEGFKEKVTAILKRAAEAIRVPVGRVVRGLATVIAWVRRQAKHDPPPPLTPGTRFRDFAGAPEMIVVPAGTFSMGPPEGKGDREEYPQHEVTIAKPFAVGIAPVTRGEFAAFVEATKYRVEMGAHVWTGTKWETDPKRSWRDPGFPQTDDHPVVCVNWHDAKAYVAWLKERSGKEYRLLSEAEWEYCCRAGTVTAYNTGETITAAQANFGRPSEGTTPVSSFPANAWGLFDMHGNVWEWCEDNWHHDYTGNPPADSSVWPGGDRSYRVGRGGSWFNLPQILRSAQRGMDSPSHRSSLLGFRLARTL